MINWKLRPAGVGDAYSIAQHRYFKGEPRADIDAYVTWLSPRIERGAYVGFVADDQGIVIAGAGAVLLDWGPTRGEPSGTRARIVNVFTEHGRRGRGIAKALVESVMVACEDLGVRVFSLAASPDGANMYRSLGFVPYENEMILRR